MPLEISSVILDMECTCVCICVWQLLEEASAENSRVEQEVIILRHKVYGINRTTTGTSLAVIRISFNIILAKLFMDYCWKALRLWEKAQCFNG